MNQQPAHSRVVVVSTESGADLPFPSLASSPSINPAPRHRTQHLLLLLSPRRLNPHIHPKLHLPGIHCSHQSIDPAPAHIDRCTPMGGCKGVMVRMRMICSLLALQVLVATTRCDALRVLPRGPNFYTKLTSTSGPQTVDVLMHNTAQREVALVLAEMGKEAMVAKRNEWTDMGVLTLDLNKNAVLHMDFTLTDDKSLQQAKHLEVDMLKQAIVQVQGKKSIIFDAIEDAGSSVVTILLGFDEVLKFYV